jgi:hypothetical protein
MDTKANGEILNDKAINFSLKKCHVDYILYKILNLKFNYKIYLMYIVWVFGRIF